MLSLGQGQGLQSVLGDTMTWRLSLILSLIFLAGCAVRVQSGMSFVEFESRCASKYLEPPVTISMTPKRAVYKCGDEKFHYIFEGGRMVEKRRIR